MAAVIVWRVADTAKASFDVEDYENFVRIQTETTSRTQPVVNTGTLYQ